MTERTDAPNSPRDSLIEWVECEEFYNLMQAYRIAPVTDQERTLAAYRAVKGWIADFTLAELSERMSETLPHSQIEAERLLRITRENFEIECSDADKILALFPDLHRSEGGRLPVAALVNAICEQSVRLKRSEPAAPSSIGTLDMSDAARLKDAEEDVLRLHGEKMKFFERVIDLERELARAIKDRDARAREACTFEKRATCSFAMSAIVPTNEPYWLIERGSPCEWWVAGTGAGDGTMLNEEWTADSSKAQRFNKWGAEVHAKELERWGVKGPLRATEHLDCHASADGGRVE